MKIRALNSAGDWQFGNGLGSFLTKQGAIAENVQTSLLCFKYDAFWNTPFGVDWWNLLGGKNPAAETGILLQVREMIISCFGITAINSVDVIMDSQTRKITVLYNLNSIFSCAAFSNVVAPIQ